MSTYGSFNEKELKMFKILVFILLSILTKGTLAYSIDDESKLQTDLLNGYNINVRPADQVFVQGSLAINNLLSLDIVDQTLAVIGSMAIIWNDHRLSWNMSEYGNVSDVYFKSGQIWRPTLVLKNSVTGIEVIGDDGNQKSIPMSVSSTGFVFWLAPAYFISSCSVDISKFPFDTQKCEIVISTWMFSASTVKLNTFDDSIDMERFDQNGEYDVIQTYARVDIDPFLSFTLEYLVFGIELRRKYSYYLINIVLPVFFMQLLGIVVFAVPTDSGEKLSFALTLLLSLTVMMTLVAEKIPTTSLQIPTLSLYMLGGTIISSLELIMTVYILHLKHNKKDKYKMSKNMKRLATFLTFLLCMKRNKIESQNEPFSKTANNNTLVIVQEVTKEEELEKTTTGREEEDTTEQCQNTYEDIAIMMDRFSIILFGFLTFTFTFVMLFMIL